MKKISPFLFFLLIACAAPQLAPEDQVYLNRAMACPLIFIIEKDHIGEAWSRAQTWIAQYSDMKIQISTDYVIQTYNPTKMGAEFIAPVVKYGYSITSVLNSTSYTITVQCFSNTLIMSKAGIDRNSHILAYFIQTGEIKPQFIYKNR